MTIATETLLTGRLSTNAIVRAVVEAHMHIACSAALSTNGKRAHVHENGTITIKAKKSGNQY